MPGEEFEICVRPDATPFAVSAPRRVPFALRERLLRELQRLEADGIITPVIEPTAWCALIVVCQKKNEAGARLCFDLSRLNNSVRRGFYLSSTPIECVTCIISEEARYFAAFDALKGYHQCPLELRSQLLMTFITLFGRFMYERAPYGVSSICEDYNRRKAQCLRDLPGMRRLVDDVFIYGRTRDELLQRLRLFLQRCRQHGVSLNRDKVQFLLPAVRFAGFLVSPSGYRPDPALADAVRGFPAPVDISGLRGFFGPANQMAPFSDSVAWHLQPLRSLLSTRRDFVWDDGHQEAFVAARELLASPATLSYYDPSLPTACRRTRAAFTASGSCWSRSRPTKPGGWYRLALDSSPTPSLDTPPSSWSSPLLGERFPSATCSWPASRTSICTWTIGRWCRS